MGVRACSPSSARWAGWSGPSTSRAAPRPGAGRPATPSGALKCSLLTEEPDHTSDDADQGDAAGHDRLVSGVLGDELDVPVAALDALDGGPPSSSATTIEPLGASCWGRTRTRSPSRMPALTMLSPRTRSMKYPSLASSEESRTCSSMFCSARMGVPAATWPTMGTETALRRC